MKFKVVTTFSRVEYGERKRKEIWSPRVSHYTSRRGPLYNLYV